MRGSGDMTIDIIYGEMSVVAEEFGFAPHLRDFGF